MAGISELQVILKGVDNASPTLKGVGNKMDTLRKHALKAGIALTAMGAAGLKMVDSARKMNAQLGVTALNLDVTTKEMRDLALSTTNVTFPLQEVLDSFDLLARAGIEDIAVLQATATAFDSLGDATGYSASEVTKTMVPAMKTFGLTAEEIANKVDLITFMSRESTMSLEDFSTMIGYTTPELVKQGLTIDDLTIALIHMEKQGYAPGRVMTREFMKATTAAAAEQIPLTEALGITTVEMDLYRESLEGIDGMTAKYSETANEQYGIMDRLRQKWHELTLQYGSFLQPLEPILASMTALGPMLMLFSTVLLPKLTFATMVHTTALIAQKVAQWALNAAMMANPIGLITIAIAGLIAIGILLAKNWDDITARLKRAWESVGNVFARIGDVLWKPIQWAVDKVLELWGLLKAFWAWLRGLFYIERAPAGAAIAGALGMMPGFAALPYYGATPAVPGIGGFQGFQRGGIIRRPTMGLLGEAGPEAVIPLDKAGLGGVTVNFNEPVFMENEASMNKLADKIRLVFRRQERHLYGGIVA